MPVPPAGTGEISRQPVNPPAKPPHLPIGRFAPSPTGPLHAGSLLAALASFLDARAGGGQWLLRIEDIDPLREMPSASDSILRTLDAYGLHWDGPVQYQSQHLDRYQAALARLADAGLTYRCSCSRQALGDAGHYPGTCRERQVPPGVAHAIRLRIPEGMQSFTDLVQGEQHCELTANGGDFVVYRKDHCVAYQLATAVDDAESGITRVVRGSDLLDSTFRQRLLMQYLGFQPPEYAHIPVVVNREGRKLSKQTHAPALQAGEAIDQLLLALQRLGQPLPDSRPASPATLLEWAIGHWSLSAIPRCMSLPDRDFCKPAGA